MADIVVENSNYQPSGQRQTLLSSVLAGLVAGIVGWLLQLSLKTWVIAKLFCDSPDTFAVCSNGGTIAWVVAMVIVGIASLLVLVRSGVFRPLLVILASLIALWGANLWLGPLEWWQAMLWHGGLFALAFGLFAWIARINKFLLALIVTIVIVVLARLVVINA